MQYKVPQDVQREDRIIGPITLKQLIILGTGGGLAYATYVSLARFYYIEVWLAPVAIISGLTLAFAFLKIHNLPFHIYILSQLQYRLLPRKRFWIQRADTPFVSYEQRLKDIQARTLKDKQEAVKKPQKSIEELSRILDQQEKKDQLKKMVDQNYK